MPPKRRIKTIQPPIGGVVRSTGFQHQPPFTAYDSTDYWPLDVKTGRMVTATRPALAGFTAPGTTVNSITPVNGHLTDKPYISMVATSGGTIYWYDDVGWVSATGAAASSADTGRAVFGTPYILEAFICKANSAPIVFNYSSGAATIASADVGAFPEDCRVAFTWEGSLCLAGALEAPHVINISRTGNPRDWDFSVSLRDRGGAFTSAGSDEGLLNGPITAGFSHTGDTAIISTFQGIVALRGHPRRGGEPDLISASTYILGQGAWCRTPGDRLYFMTTEGLMTLGPDPRDFPKPVSADKIPDELVGLAYDYEDPTVAMAYDRRWRMVFITDRTAQIAWAFHVPTGGFHRMSLSNYPYVMHEHRPLITDDRSGVLLGSS